MNAAKRDIFYGSVLRIRRRSPTQPSAHKKFKPSKKGTSCKTKWCSRHNTTYHNDAECKVQAAGKSSQDSPARQTRGRGNNADAATQGKTREEVTVSKDGLVSVMKRISTSLQEQYSATAPGSGNSVGFSFTAAREDILSASTNETVKTTMVVYSGPLGSLRGRQAYQRYQIANV